MSFTRQITETFGGQGSSGDTSDVTDVPKSQVIVGLQLSRSTWDKALGAISVAVAVGTALYLKNSFWRWRERVNQEYVRKEQARLLRKRNAVATDVFHAARYPEDARVELDLHRAECHCGRIKCTLRAPVHLRAVDCSTSMATKKGRFPYIFVDSADFRLDCGGDFLSVYTHCTHTAKHMFCSACGVHVFAFPRGTAEAGGISVNVHTIERDNVLSLHVAFVPGDHLMHDYEPTVPMLPTSPNTRRARSNDSLFVSSSNPQASSNSTSPKNATENENENNATTTSSSSPPQEQQTYQVYQPSSYSPPPMAATSLTQLLSPGLPRAVEVGTMQQKQEEQRQRRQVGTPGEVNFFRKTRGGSNAAYVTPICARAGTSMIHTLVHGGGAAAYAIGRAAGVLSPENQLIDNSFTLRQTENNMSTPFRSNATAYSSLLSSSTNSSNPSSSTQARYRTQQISPVRAMIEGHDPMYNRSVRLTEVKKLESMNSVVSIKHQLQRYLGQHKTPQKEGRRQVESSFYD